jgi:glucan 1,3-beta-glucosidase
MRANMVSRKSAFGLLLWSVWAGESPPSVVQAATAAVVTNHDATAASASRFDFSRLLHRNGTASDDEQGDDTSDSTQFMHFIAHNKTMTCSADEHARPFNNQIRGVNLGGWMVLEPWITPSLFYQFLGKGEGATAFDMYTFCQVLGSVEANAQLKRHWDAWVTEDIIRTLKESGAVNSLRLPVGDFMYVPYGPYADGCVDGALERVDQLLDWAYSYGLSVLIDVHTMRDSQNGFDNSGQAMGFAWTSARTFL